MGRYSHRVETNPLSEIDRYFAARADTPFGDVDMASGRALQRFSIAGQRRAANLLLKATRALDDDDPERARAYVERAVRLPYDRHEKNHPAAMEAHMLVFNVVIDALEDSAEDDPTWLDAAIEAMSTADERGRCTMRDVLMAVDQDYDVSRAERRALRSATAAVPDRPEMKDLDLAPDEMAGCVESVLAVVRDYGDARFAT